VNVTITFQREDCIGEPFRLTVFRHFVKTIEDANVLAEKVVDNINLFTYGRDRLRIITVELSSE